MVGSPGFMSPEQAEGKAVGPPSDIFSLGAVLAFAATGRGPFGSGSTPALVYRVVHSGPQLDLMPAEVRSLTARCLAKDPALRPTAAGLLAAAASPAAGWLPEAVTRPRAAASLTMTAIPAPQAPAPAPPVPERSAAGPGRPPRQAPRPAWRQAWRQAWRRGRWRPLIATLVLSGLIGAGATAAVTMTAGPAPARAAQSAPLAAPPQTPAPASTPASPASSAPRASSPPATMTPPASSAPPSPTTSPSTSPSPGPSSSASSAPPGPAPGSPASLSPAVY